jgi:hypothetical protein
MIITMHDELVFEIDADVLEEAISVITHLMTSNDYVMIKNWPVPLTTDVEMGFDWTVPWDLNAMRYGEVRYHNGKKYKKPEDLPQGVPWTSLPSWPEELRQWFKESNTTTPQSVIAGAPAAKGTTQVCPLKLPCSLSIQAAIAIAEALVQCKDTGDTIPQLLTASGVPIMGWQDIMGPGIIKVDADLFTKTVMEKLEKKQLTEGVSK